jgi:hypothetical protein
MKKYFCVIAIATLFSTTILANPETTNLWIIKNNDSRPLLVLNQKFNLIPKIIKQKTSDYHIDVRYPSIENANSNVSAQHFNQAIQNMVTKNINTFKQELKNNKTNSAKSKNTLKITYELFSAVSQSQKTEFVSTRFTSDSMEQGMAHPSQQTEILNYDLGHDRVLTLSDLFIPNSPYLEKIAAYCAQQFQGKDIPPDMIKAGTAPTLENYQHWNLTLDGLLITFDEAQVAPRYFGRQEVIVPNSVLKELYTHAVACTMSIINCDGT